MDRRVRKTKKIIKDVFIDLLSKKKLNKITVSEIVEKSDISRGTFYLHYKDVYDLYDQLENELFMGLENLYINYAPVEERHIIKLTASILDYIFLNKDLFIIFITSDTGGHLSRKLRNSFTEKLMIYEADEENLGYSYLESKFLVGGFVGIIEDWLIGGMKESKESISRMLHEIFLRFY